MRLAILLLAVGCRQITGINSSTTPASPLAVTVDGLRSGASVTLELSLDGETQDLDVSADGTYSFSITGLRGDPYSVTVTKQPVAGVHECGVDRGSGTVSGSPITVHCRAADLASLRLSLPDPITPALVWNNTRYDLHASHLAQQAYVLADSVDPDGTVSLDGTPFSGRSSQFAITADTTLMLSVASASLRQTYDLAIHRDVRPAQWIYAKAATDNAECFGCAIAIENDTLIVGGQSGVAAFERIDGAWTPEPFPEGFSSGYGNSISLQGDVLAVGSVTDSAVNVFNRSNHRWTLTQTISSPHSVDDSFGYSVALRDGLLVIGAPDEAGADDAGPAGSGAVYVYRVTGTAWNQVAHLDVLDRQAGGRLGISVAIEGGGLAFLSGAPGNGAVFRFSQGGGWYGGHDPYVAAPNGGGFGWSLAIDGDSFIVGAPYENNSTGAAYLEPAGTRLVASTPQIDSWFGFAAGLAGNIAVVGAFRENSSGRGVDSPVDNAAPTSGAGYVFESGVQTHYLKSLSSSQGDQLGFSVAVSRDSVVLGAIGDVGSGTGLNPTDDNVGNQTGAVYIFN